MDCRITDCKAVFREGSIVSVPPNHFHIEKKDSTILSFHKKLSKIIKRHVKYGMKAMPFHWRYWNFAAGNSHTWKTRCWEWYSHTWKESLTLRRGQSEKKHFSIQQVWKKTQLGSCKSFFFVQNYSFAII